MLLIACGLLQARQQADEAVDFCPTQSDFMQGILTMTSVRADFHATVYMRSHHQPLVHRTAVRTRTVYGCVEECGMQLVANWCHYGNGSPILRPDQNHL